MKKRQKLVAVIFAAAVGGAIIYAHAAGPDPRHTAAPGDDPLACATAGCHTGVPLNKGGGNVQVQFASNPPTYTPGVPQTFTIVITDPAESFFGFQMTARLESNLANGQAGLFTSGTHQIVICDDGSLATASGCPTGQVEFIEHNQPFTSNMITVSWTPPSTNVGNVHIYVAANAANNVISPNNSHIYTNNYTLTPAASGPTPSISAVTSLTFNGITAVAPGSAVAVFGSNLASNGTGSTIPLPNTLGGSQVLFGSIAAPIYASSSGLINVQVPWEVGTGTVNVFVSNNGITSAAFPIQVASIAPGVWPVQIGSKVYGGVVNVGDGTFAWPTGIAPGAALPQHPAKAGDILSIYSTGLGPVTPSVTTGQNVTDGQNHLPNTNPTVLINGVQAQVLGSIYIPQYVGLDLINIKVPSGLPSGDLPIQIQSGGVTSTNSVLVSITQ